MIKLIYEQLQKPQQTAAAAARGGASSQQQRPITALDISSITIGKKIGKGAHGLVKRGKLRLGEGGGDVDVAIKSVPYDDPESSTALQRELSILVRLRHSRIVHLFGTCDDEEEEKVLAVLELCEIGSLERIIDVCAGDEANVKASQAAALLNALDGEVPSDGSGGGGGGGSSLSVVRAARQRVTQLLGGPLPGIGSAFFRIVCDVGEALAYLHYKRVVHGDIKPGNILIDSQGRARVADFGVARTVSSTLGASKRSSIGGGGARGTPGYMAPEVLRGASPKKPSDVFSFAMLVSMLLTGDAPFGHLQDPMQIGFAMVNEGARPPLPSSLSSSSASEAGGLGADVESLVQRCWAAEASDRPEARDIDRELVRLSTEFRARAHADAAAARERRLEEEIERLKRAAARREEEEGGAGGTEGGRVEAAAAEEETAAAEVEAPAAVTQQQLSPEEQKKVDKDLLTAAQNGDEEGVRDLLDRGANPNGAKTVR